MLQVFRVALANNSITINNNNNNSNNNNNNTRSQECRLRRVRSCQPVPTLLPAIVREMDWKRSSGIGLLSASHGNTPSVLPRYLP